jgi:glycosyltransferase involved in cell wall biosynthesis
MSAVHRVALIASHVIQYQAPFFRLLARRPELELTVYFCSRAGAEAYRDEEMKTTLAWDLDLLGGYEHRFLRNFGSGDGYARLINPGVIPAILSGNYDAVIFFLGWGTITSLMGLAACRMSGTPIVMYGDSSFPPPEDTLARKLRAGFMRSIVRFTDAFLTSGRFNAEYYFHYGADPRRFFHVPWAIDNERFEAASRFAPGEREALRARFGIGTEEMVVVYSGKLLPRKDPMTLLRAVDAMKHRDKTAVLFLGHGELREELESFARERNVHAIFPGFVNQADLPKHYAMADAFCLPSLDDPRATVVNEAMACGLPILITDRCGPSGDIAAHGDNAFVFPAGDVQALARHFDALAASPELRERMSERSKQIIAGWDYEAGVRGVLEAVGACR